MDISNHLKNIVFLMKNGIEENGTIRSFNMLDFYFLTNITFSNFIVLCGKYLDKGELKVLNSFVIKNRDIKSLNSKTIQEIFDQKNEINCEIGKDGFPIPGTGRIVTKEEKQNIMDYLSACNIPLNNKSYNIAYNRYIKGMLDVTKPKKITKKLK